MLNRPKRQRRLPPLNALRAFEVAARHMSFSIAASELNVTQSAISRQIKTLEDFLGIELFKRLPRSLELTEGGARFAEPLHEAFDQLYEATETVLHPHRPATLNINVLPTFAMKWLIPRLLHFTAANPNIEVRMITSIRPADFRMDDNDIAVRVAPFSPTRKKDPSPIDLIMTQNWMDVRSVPFLPDVLIAVCAPALQAGGQAIRVPADLRHHTLLQVATREKAWPFWLESMGLDATQFGDHTSYGHFFMTIQAAIEGKGVALVPHIFVENELKSGMLMQLFGGKGVQAGVYHFLCRESQWHNPKIERFREWLFKEQRVRRTGNKKASQAGQLRPALMGELRHLAYALFRIDERRTGGVSSRCPQRQNFVQSPERSNAAAAR